MTADTITLERIAALGTVAKIASDSLDRLLTDVSRGNVGPEEAAAEINEILANLNAANQ